MRKWFNENFSEPVYKAYLEALNAKHPGALEFRVAETPVFCDKNFTGKMLSACESIIDVVTQYNFKTLTAHAIPADIKVPNENDHSHFIAFDFGVCENEQGELEPQLIEMQGFPTLFAYQVLHWELTKKYFNIPDSYDAYLNDFTKETYLQLLKEIIVGDCEPENVILLEVLPHKQKN